VFCQKCGTQNDDNNYKCINCGENLHPVHQTTIIQTDDGSLGGLIPYKNSSALIAYYVGIFSIIPCFAFIPGVIAFILGLKGLRFAKEHPEAKGEVRMGGHYNGWILWIYIPYYGYHTAHRWNICHY